MQIIDLAIQLNNLNEKKADNICRFISYFSKTYVKVNVNYILDDASHFLNRDLSSLLVTENTLADLDHSFLFRTFTIKLSKLNKRLVNYANKNKFSLRVTTRDLKNIELLKSFKGDVELTYEVNKDDNLVDLYNNVKEKGYRSPLRLSYIDDENSLMLNSLDSLETYQDLFNYWLNDKDGIMLLNFKHFVDAAFGGSFKECYNDNCLGKRFYLDLDNNIYICEKSSLKEYSFGNVSSIRTLKEIYESKAFKTFNEALKNKHKKCESCSCFKHCQSGCLSDSIKNENDINKIDNKYSSNYQIFYQYVKEVIDELTKNKVSLKELNPRFREILIDSLKVDIRL